MEQSDVTRRADFRAVIVGAGQGGVPLAKALARAGWKVALIERRFVGGTCINYGCTPTKTLVASARVAQLARRADDYGVAVGGVRVEMARVRARKAEIVARFRQGNVEGLEQQANLTLLRGHARFIGPSALRVDTDEGTLTLAPEVVVLDVGQRPRIPEVPGLAEAPYLSSSTVMELAEVPEHLLILGGGYVGVEFAQMFRRFGSAVTVAQQGEQLLPREDEDVAEAVREILAEDGVRVLSSANATGVRGAAGGLELTLADGTVLAGSHLLVATGRQPNTDGLGLAAAGIATDDEGHIAVDERLRTGAQGVYALGDAAGSPAFTHIAYDDYRVLESQLLGDGRRTTQGRLLPYVVYLDPQLGRIGLSERQARERGVAYACLRLPMAQVARARETGETRGFMKALVAPEDKRILGAMVLGSEGGELMSALEIAMMGNLSAVRLRDGIFAHPTLAESFNTLFAGLE